MGVLAPAISPAEHALPDVKSQLECAEYALVWARPKLFDYQVKLSVQTYQQRPCAQIESLRFVFDSPICKCLP